MSKRVLVPEAPIDGDSTAENHRGLKPAWKPGQSGNPSGRPKGSRNKLGEAFLADMLADWLEHGADAIRQMRERRPADYVRVVASILPRELNVKVDEVADMSDDELAAQLDRLLELLPGPEGSTASDPEKPTLQ